MPCQPISSCRHNPKATAMVAVTLIALTAVALTALHMKGIHLGKLDPYMAKIPPYGTGIIFGGAGVIALVDIGLIVRHLRQKSQKEARFTLSDVRILNDVSKGVYPAIRKEVLTPTLLSTFGAEKHPVRISITLPPDTYPNFAPDAKEHYELPDNESYTVEYTSDHYEVVYNLEGLQPVTVIINSPI